jgi:hypothetical protein
MMKHVVVYKNPNNVIRTEPYTFETHSKKELNEFLDRTRQYPGSYEVLSTDKVSEAKTKRN